MFPWAALGQGGGWGWGWGQPGVLLCVPSLILGRENLFLLSKQTAYEQSRKEKGLSGAEMF